MPPKFQGDERDVVFLSLVDDFGDEILPAKGDYAYGGIAKRLNVASNRARDQLWGVHSLDLTQIWGVSTEKITPREFERSKEFRDKGFRGRRK